LPASKDFLVFRATPALAGLLELRVRAVSEAQLVETVTMGPKEIPAPPASPDLLVLRATKEGPALVVNQVLTV